MHEPRQAEVGQAEIAVLTNKQVLRLKVAVHDLILVQGSERNGYLSNVELGVSLGKLFDLL